MTTNLILEVSEQTGRPTKLSPDPGRLGGRGPKADRLGGRGPKADRIPDVLRSTGTSAETAHKW